MMKMIQKVKIQV